jgi:hypothetical protein
VFTPGSAQAWFRKLQLLKVITNMKKGLLNFKMRALAVLLNGYEQPSTILCLILSTVVTLGWVASPAAVFADDTLSEATSEQKGSPAARPKMGDCQFYIKTEAIVNGQKNTVIAGAGAHTITAKGSPLDAECKGKCDMKGPNGGDCGCGYISIDGPPQITGFNDDGTPRLEVLTTYHGCNCVELIEE